MGGARGEEERRERLGAESGLGRLCESEAIERVSRVRQRSAALVQGLAGGGCELRGDGGRGVVGGEGCKRALDAEHGGQRQGKVLCAAAAVMWAALQRRRAGPLEEWAMIRRR